MSTETAPALVLAGHLDARSRRGIVGAVFVATDFVARGGAAFVATLSGFAATFAPPPVVAPAGTAPGTAAGTAPVLAPTTPVEAPAATTPAPREMESGRPGAGAAA